MISLLKAFPFTVLEVGTNVDVSTVGISFFNAISVMAIWVAVEGMDDTWDTVGCLTEKVVAMTVNDTKLDQAFC